MIKKTITYKDYNGVERTEDFRFHFTKAEILEMETSEIGGMSTQISRIIAAQNTSELIKIWKDFVLKAYGEISADGRRFQKTDDIVRNFSETEAYSILFMELATDTEAAIEFIKGIMPSDMPVPDIELNK